MDIDEGSSTNFAFDIRETELAIIDTSDPKKDRVMVIPESMLRQAEDDQKPIQNDLLPFDVVVKEYFVNSKLENAGPG